MLVKMFPSTEDAAKIQAAKSKFPHEKWTSVQIISLCHKHRDLELILQKIIEKQ
jgi:hypothetical protein